MSSPTPSEEGVAELVWRTFGKTMDELTCVDLDRLQATMIRKIDRQDALIRAELRPSSHPFGDDAPTGPPGPVPAVPVAALAAHKAARTPAPPARRGPDPIAVVAAAKALTRAAIAADRAASRNLATTRGARRGGRG